LEVGLLDLVLGVDADLVDEAGLEALELEGQLGGQVTGGAQLAVHALIQLTILADDHHALADVDVQNRGHDSSCRFFFTLQGDFMNSSVSRGAIRDKASRPWPDSLARSERGGAA